MNLLLEVRGLGIDIEGRKLCEGLDLQIEAGQSWALLGGNGVGKTTLLHHFAGLRCGHQGSLALAGRAIDTYTAKARARQVGLLLQHSNRGFGAGVRETVLGGRYAYQAAFVRESAHDEAVADQALTDLGLDTLRDRTLDQLSGGELRRVEIARLLAQQTPLSLLDEPLNHLDLSHQAICLGALLSQCVDNTRAMLMVLHDLNTAYHACDHWLILDADGAWHTGTRETLADPALLSRIYGHPVNIISSTDGPVFHSPVG